MPEPRICTVYWVFNLSNQAAWSVTQTADMEVPPFMYHTQKFYEWKISSIQSLAFSVYLDLCCNFFLSHLLLPPIYGYLIMGCCCLSYSWWSHDTIYQCFRSPKCGLHLYKLKTQAKQNTVESRIYELTTEKHMLSKMNLLASRDEVNTARSGAKGVINLTRDGNVLCI